MLLIPEYHAKYKASPLYKLHFKVGKRDLETTYKFCLQIRVL